MKRPKYVAFAYVCGDTEDFLVAYRMFATEQAKDNWCNSFGSKYMGQRAYVIVEDYNTCLEIERWTF